MALTRWVPIPRYRPYRGWVYAFSCGHYRYDINSVIFYQSIQSTLYCYHCERPRVVTACLMLDGNLTP